MADIHVIKARKILTMDRVVPEATHVAIKDGRILAVGGADCAAQWGDFTVDKSLSNAVLLPGFVEGHAHLMAGSIWEHTYVGYHDRTDPDGTLWSGISSTGHMIERLQAVADDAPVGDPVFGWGFDPIFITSERLNRAHLDRVSPDRPVADSGRLSSCGIAASPDRPFRQSAAFP